MKIRRENSITSGNGFIEIELTPDELILAYEEQKYRLLMEDARAYVKDYDEKWGTNISENMSDDDVKYLVDQFNERAYYYDPTRQLWTSIVEEFAEDMESEGESMKRSYVRANEIAEDYIKNNLFLESSYGINGLYYITLSQSMDIVGGICAELYSEEDGLIDALTETKETLKDGLCYLMDIVSDEMFELDVEYFIDVTFSIYKGKVTIQTKDVESGIERTWSAVDLSEHETLGRICGQVGEEIMSWIQLRAEALEDE